jgi:hypothetical protein
VIGVAPSETLNAPASDHRIVMNDTSVTTVDSRSSDSASVVVANDWRSSVIRWSGLSARWSRSIR